MTERTGGPAFPCDEIHDQHPWDESGIYRHQKADQGMTLRDYFAAKAMPAVYRDLWDDVRAGRHNCVSEDWRMGVALDAYAMADAMLSARGAEKAREA